MNDNKIQRFYIPELDGLRFVAFLLVFIHNSPYLESSPIWTALHEYGWIGVDLFFCLSAFLITKLLVREQQQQGNIKIRIFYFRRILRIWPLYFIYIAFAILYVIQDQGWNNIILKHTFGLLTFTYNFIYLLLTYKIFFVFAHLWTISYEEQFYMAIPWIIQKLTVAKRKIELTFLLITFLLGNGIRAILIFYNVKHPVIYMMPFTHFEALLCGIAMGLGLFDQMLMKFQGWTLLFFGVLFNTAVFFLPNIYTISWKLMLTYPLSGFGMALIIYAIIYRKKLAFSNLLKTRVLTLLGKISYGLYMYHILSISIVNEVSIRIFNVNPLQHQYYPIFLFIVGLSLTIILAIVSYNWIEIPFLKLKERYSLTYLQPI